VPIGRIHRLAFHGFLHRYNRFSRQSGDVLFTLTAVQTLPFRQISGAFIELASG
jgi:hypothetical protein